MMTEDKKLCIYHGNCADGFGAAWVVRKFFGEEHVEFFAGFYGKEPPDVTDRDVIMVDFSYKRAPLIHMGTQAKSMLILDHHVSARDDLADIQQHFEDPDKITTVFDMNRSGAMLAWDTFFPTTPAPSLIHHIQDRDLWLFKLEGTREIQATLFSYPYDFRVWDTLMDINPSQLLTEGRAIERKHHKDINELIEVSKRRMTIGGFNVPVANLPYTLSSDAGHQMGKGEPFAACYMDGPDGRIFSLRSAPEGVDVSEIAKAFGGGGHKHAAGFKAPLNWEGDFHDDR